MEDIRFSHENLGISSLQEAPTPALDILREEQSITIWVILVGGGDSHLRWSDSVPWRIPWRVLQSLIRFGSHCVRRWSAHMGRTAT